jgi:isoleucyl-tRNA synthetase
MDKWILAATQSLVAFVTEEMKAYRLYTVMPRLVGFIEQLTNWYIKLNRTRLRGNTGEEDCSKTLNTLFEVLVVSTKTMAPFTPFFTENLYQNLRNVLPTGEQEESKS